MVWLVLACLTALLVLLLLAPVSLRLRLRGSELSLSAHYLFVRYDLSAQAMERRRQRRERKKKAPEPPSSGQAPPAEEAPPKKAKTTLHTALRLLKSVPHGLAILRRHVVVYRVRADIVVAQADAHATALAYGRVCTVCSVALALLGELFVLRRARIGITPDFTRETGSCDIALRIRLSPLFALWAALAVLLQLARKPGGNRRKHHMRRRRKKTEHMQQNRKGG